MNMIKNNNIEISVITVCFNSEKTIKTTLESVKKQSLKNIEHIIVDGSSDDETSSIIKKYPHISKSISEEDNLLYVACTRAKEILIINGFTEKGSWFTDSLFFE